MIDQLIRAVVTALAVTHAHYPLVFNLWLPLMFGAYIAVNCERWRLRAMGQAIAPGCTRIVIAMWRA